MKPRDLIPQRQTRGGLVREMLFGADENAPDRPGRHLETPQRLGIVPTFAFWNRRDVWRSARWFVAPVAGLSVFAVTLIPFPQDPWLWPWRGVIGGALPVLLAMGGLERYIRRRIRERNQLRAQTRHP